MLCCLLTGMKPVPTIKINNSSLTFSSKEEVRMHLGKKTNKFILSCARFALTLTLSKLGFALTMKIKNLRILFCIVFGFH